MLRFFSLLIPYFIFFQIGNECFAQDVDKLIKKGIDELKKKHDIPAYNYFLDALYLEPENKKAKLYAGICHLHLQSPQKALEYLTAVQGSDEAKQLADYQGYLAMAYHLNLDFENAEKTINNLKDTASLVDVDIDLIKQNIQNAVAQYKTEHEFTVLNMGERINTRQHEYGTAAFSDHQSVLYTHRPDLWDQDTLKSKLKLYENVFMVELDSNYNWDDPHYFTNPHLRGNDAVIQVFDNDTKLLTYHNGDLLISKKDGDFWEKGEPIKEINTPANESHGFITDDGKTLYFSSNFDTHDGNLNLYVTRNEGGEWSEPEELVGLNTPYDEDAPFIAEDGYLYFSSKGHTSIGNYDIFRTKFNEEEQTWSVPENLGVPINSVFDDLFYATYGRMAYFSSLRPGGQGGMDLYRVVPFKQIEISGKLTDAETGEILANASESIDLGKGSFKVKSDAEGNYSANVPLQYSSYLHVAKGTSGENVLVFHFGDSTSGIKEVNVPLAVFSNEIPTAKLDISPSQNSDEKEENLAEENQILAQEDTIKNTNEESISEKVDEELLAKNIMQENTEGNIETNDIDQNEKSEQENPPKNIEENIAENSTEESIKQPNVEGITLNQEKVQNNTFENNETINRIRSGKSTNLYLYFDFGAAIINEVFYTGLDEIASFLESDESITIEIGGHTDNVGSETYNQQLSERRAKAVALYLIERGIDKSRVIAKGYGESMPIASNDDEKEGRELNRRVEVKKLTQHQISSLSE